MDSKNINRLWMIKQLKFFRFLFYLSLLGCVLAFFLLGSVPFFIFVMVALLLASISDMVRIGLDYPAS